MGYVKHKESLPDRRIIVPKSQDQTLVASRRGKRFVSLVFRQRLLFCLFLLTLVFFLMYSAYFGVKIHFHGSVSSFKTLKEEHSVNIGSEEEHGVYIGSEQSKKKPRRPRYLPCEVSFVDSVTHSLNPEENAKFARFSLDYVQSETNTLFEKARFRGYQTLQDRERSYHATNQTIHCGFVRGSSDDSRSAGFDLNEKDSEFMKTCKIVVASCIFGSSDFLRRPASKKISDYSKKNVCFVMFLDEESQSKLSTEGNVPDENGNIGLWRIVVVKNLPYEDLRKMGKVPKFLSHRLFPSSRYSIWLDSKLRLNADPMLIIEYFLWRKESEYAISNHYTRHCVWDEVIQNKRLNKYNHTTIDEQFHYYQSDGLTKYDSSDPRIPLPSYVPEGSVIVRAHTPMSNLFSCLWFNEVDRFTSRDQLSFAYTYLKLTRTNPDKRFYLNMFKDCERRAITKLFHHRADT